MNSTKKYNKVQESLLVQANPSESNPLLGVIGGSASALQAPPRRGGEMGEALLYHSNHNSDKQSEKKEKKNAYKPTSLQTKTFNALKLNCENWLQLYGDERIGILTLTFAEHLTDLDEGQRRLNNLFRLINRDKKFQWLVRVVEAQKNGRIHYHILIKTNQNIKGNIDWEIYEKMGETRHIAEKRKLGRLLSNSAEKHLVELWSYLRKKCKSTGFGRHELMPLRKPHHIKNYIGKYMEKDYRNNDLKKNGKNTNKRLVTYSIKAPKVANTLVCHVNGKARVAREKLKKFANDRGIKDADEMRELFGKHWSHHLHRFIKNDEYMATYRANEFQELHDPDKPNKMVLPWKGTIVSGAFSHPTIEAITEEYLSDDIVGKRNFRDHQKHYDNWVRAEAEIKKNERIYG